MVEVLKVSSKSSPNAVAGALAAVVRQTGEGEIQVVGAGALNQAVKAIAIARGYLEPAGVDLVCVPTFADIEIAGEQRTAIRLRCQNRVPGLPANGDRANADRANGDRANADSVNGDRANADSANGARTIGDSINGDSVNGDSVNGDSVNGGREQGARRVTVDLRTVDVAAVAGAVAPGVVAPHP